MVPTPASLADKYRGATITDLDPPTSLSIPTSSSISAALLSALSHDYTHLTVTDPTTRRLAGYVAIPALQALLARGAVSEADPVSMAMRRFKTKGRVYWVCTPETPLEELEVFFQGGDPTADAGADADGAGAIGGAGEPQDFAVVTDAGRKFVLGVATREDLDEFVKRRPK